MSTVDWVWLWGCYSASSADTSVGRRLAKLQHQQTARHWNCLEMPFQASSGLICKAQRQLDPAGWQLAGNCVFLLLIVCVALKLNCFTLPRWEISLNRVPVRERNSESYRIGLENWGTCKAQHLQINRSVTSKMAKWSPWSTQTRKWSSDLLALKYPAPTNYCGPPIKPRIQSYLQNAWWRCKWACLTKQLWNVEAQRSSDWGSHESGWKWECCCIQGKVWRPTATGRH